MYFFQLIDHYAASVTVVFLAFFEIVAISWFFGIGRVSKAIKQMTGRNPSLYFRSCWGFFVPLLLIVSSYYDRFIKMLVINTFLIKYYFFISESFCI